MLWQPDVGRCSLRVLSHTQGQILGDPLGDGLYEYLCQLCKGDPLQVLQARVDQPSMRFLTRCPYAAASGCGRSRAVGRSLTRSDCRAGSGLRTGLSAPHTDPRRRHRERLPEGVWCAHGRQKSACSAFLSHEGLTSALPCAPPELETHLNYVTSLNSLVRMSTQLHKDAECVRPHVLPWRCLLSCKWGTRTR